MEPEVKDKRRYREVSLDVTPFTQSRVDIVIPFHGQYQKATKLVSSILMNTKSNPYKITLVDDASPDKQYIESFKDYDIKRPVGTEPILQTIRSEKRLGFGKALNLGLSITKNPWVLFMHSDCVVEDPHWMLELGQCLLRLKKDNVRMVSSKTQKFMSGIDPRIVSEKCEKSQDIVLKDGFLPMFCFMCHRELFSKIGLFKEYFPAGYEDEEFSYRMAYNGYQQAICGKSWVWHEGGGTFGPLAKVDPSILEEVEKNRDRCIADIKRFF